MSNADLEDDFFEAPDAQRRADLYAEFDPALQPAHAERRVFGVLAIVGLVLLGAGYAFLSSDTPSPEAAQPAVAATPASAAAASEAPAPAGTPDPTPAPALADPTARPSRLDRLIQRNASAVAGAVPSPPVAAPAPTFADARAKIEAGDFDAALALLADEAPGFERAALRGWALYELGRDADARAALREALGNRPDHAESLLLLGSLEQDRDSDAARKTYQAFLTAHPEAPEAAEVRQILERI